MRTDPILTGNLKPDDIPSPKASWRTISDFALSFDGYERFGNKRLASLANSSRKFFSEKGGLPELSLDELRCCLFFEQRRFRHFGCDPEKDDLLYIRAVVVAIREQVEHSRP